MSGRQARGIGALALLGWALVACGKKGPPVVPESRLPMPPSALQASVDENAVSLGWKNPTRRVDGSALKDLAAVKVFRHGDNGDGPLKPAVLSGRRVVGYDEIATIQFDPAAPTEAGRWVDHQGLALGRRYVYVVVAIDSVGRSSPPSDRRAVAFLAPPRPPRAVEATGGNREATLTWTAPTEFTDGSPVSGELRYLVSRGTGSGGALAVVTPEPLAATSFTDTGLDNETEYRYVVRAVRVAPLTTATGAPSDPVAVTPIETRPPTPPSNLVAIPSAGTIRLAWSSSPSAGVATYAVYRAGGTGALVRIGTTTSGNTTFIDREVQPGATYRYAVSAIDNARKPNESLRSSEVTITLP